MIFERVKYSQQILSAFSASFLQNGQSVVGPVAEMISAMRLHFGHCRDNGRCPEADIRVVKSGGTFGPKTPGVTATANKGSDTDVSNLPNCTNSSYRTVRSS